MEKNLEGPHKQKRESNKKPILWQNTAYFEKEISLKKLGRIKFNEILQQDRRLTKNLKMIFQIEI